MTRVAIALAILFSLYLARPALHASTSHGVIVRHTMEVTNPEPGG
jgi:hypothetical protein